MSKKKQNSEKKDKNIKDYNESVKLDLNFEEAMKKAINSKNTDKKK